MNRYLIFDAFPDNPEKIRLKQGQFLNSEETEAKFKEIFDAGFQCGDSDDWEAKTRKAIDEKWNILKNAL